MFIFRGCTLQKHITKAYSGTFRRSTKVYLNLEASPKFRKSPYRFNVGILVSSLKLTYPLKMDPWKRRFLLETKPFQGLCKFLGVYHPVFFRWTLGSWLLIKPHGPLLRTVVLAASTRGLVSPSDAMGQNLNLACTKTAMRSICW